MKLLDGLAFFRFMSWDSFRKEASGNAEYWNRRQITASRWQPGKEIRT
jgi:hypothetical protein